MLVVVVVVFVVIVVGVVVTIPANVLRFFGGDALIIAGARALIDDGT